MLPNFYALAQGGTVLLLSCLLEGTSVVLFAALLLRVLGRQNSGTRFAIWFSVLLGIALLACFGGRFSHAALDVARAPRPEFTVPAGWAFFVFVPWCVLAALALARVVFGLWQVHRLRQTCVPVQSAILDDVLLTCQPLVLGRKITVCSSTQVQVPTAVGFFRPIVVLPAWALHELSLEEFQAMLLHELAHLRRWDDWTNLVQKILGAVFIFHPAVWWIERQLALEREMACDDTVLAVTGNPRAYAECLVSMAEKAVWCRGLALAQAAAGRVSQLSRRVARILEVKRPGLSRGQKPAPALVVAFCFVCLAVFARVPTLIGFQDGVQQVAPQSAAAPIVAVAPKASVPFAARLIPAAARIPAAGRSYGTDTRAAGRARPRHPLRQQLRLPVYRTALLWQARFTELPPNCATFCPPVAEQVKPGVLLIAFETAPANGQGTVVFTLHISEIISTRPVVRKL